MYTIVIDRYAQKQLVKISPPYFNRIIKAIYGLSDNPRPPGYIKLTGRPGYRIRIGDYRVIYNIEDKILTVYVIDIGHHKDIYD
jgi:mRNA interferase RelE/StbE